MTVKTGSAWAGTFVTLDATGALATPGPGPAGVLYVDGTANGATVTITGSNPYKWAVTLPSLTAGQRVDMYITATISTIATAAIVASEQADTSLASDVKTDTAAILADTGTDGVLISSGTGAKQISLDSGKVLLQATQTGVTIPTVTAVTNGVGLADDAITAAKFDESTAFPVKSADTGATQIARVGADSDTLETLSDEIAAVKAETALIVADTGTDGVVLKAAGLAADAVAEIADQVWNEAIADHTTATTFGGKNQKVVPSETINDYKADVSGLATPTNITSASGVTLAPIQTGVTIPTVTTITNGVTLADDAITSAKLAASAGTELADAVLDEVVIGTYTLRQLIKVLAAGVAGKVTGGGTTTITFRGVDDTSNVIVATVDENGNRSAVTLTV